MLATINTSNVQAPFGVSLLHLVLIIQGYNQNYMKLDFLLLKNSRIAFQSWMKHAVRILNEIVVSDLPKLFKFFMVQNKF
jgi:hypothetical protein